MNGENPTAAESNFQSSQPQHDTAETSNGPGISSIHPTSDSPNALGATIPSSVANSNDCNIIDQSQNSLSGGNSLIQLEQLQPQQQKEQSTDSPCQTLQSFSPIEDDVSSRLQGKKRIKSTKKTAKLDAKSKLEKSRQSARECRARKKLRYQYLEDLVCSREKAVKKLREEMSVFHELSRQIDSGTISESDKVLLFDQSKDSD